MGSPPSSKSTLSERLSAALTHSKRTKREVEIAASITKGYLSTLTAGKRGARSGISPDRLHRLAEALDVSFEWLATGEGKMLHDGSPPPPHAAPPRAAGSNIDFAERFPMCERTIVYLKDVGGITPQVAQLARRLALDLPTDLDHRVWHAMLLDLQAKTDAAQPPRHAPPQQSSREPANYPVERRGAQPLRGAEGVDIDLEQCVEMPLPTLGVVASSTLETPVLTPRRDNS